MSFATGQATLASEGILTRLVSQFDRASNTLANVARHRQTCARFLMIVAESAYPAVQYAD